MRRVVHKREIRRVLKGISSFINSNQNSIAKLLDRELNSSIFPYGEFVIKAPSDDDPEREYHATVTITPKRIKKLKGGMKIEF